MRRGSGRRPALRATDAARCRRSRTARRRRRRRRSRSKTALALAPDLARRTQLREMETATGNRAVAAPRGKGVGGTACVAGGGGVARWTIRSPKRSVSSPPDARSTASPHAAVARSQKSVSPLPHPPPHTPPTQRSCEEAAARAAGGGCLMTPPRRKAVARESAKRRRRRVVPTNPRAEGGRHRLACRRVIGRFAMHARGRRRGVATGPD